MRGIFHESNFNKNIENWNVSKVEDMSRMFSRSPFNHPINTWNTSNVKDMNNMFQGIVNKKTQFNQSLSTWDVSNVTNMFGMFENSEFNQPIGNWNVGKVINMGNMFRNSPFNQPIGDWDVSNVTFMSEMFRSSPFNQYISKWCVTKITSEPQNFSINSPLTSQNKPKWGTCPPMDDNLLSTKLEKTVWVGDDNYKPCDCGFSGIIGFRGGMIFELSEEGSKEPSGCFPYNFWYRDYSGEIKNLIIDEYKISFNIISGTWDWFTEIEMINEKLRITTSGPFKWVQEYNLSSLKFEDYCD